jgi:putative ABC transport system substrate-binding protein
VRRREFCILLGGAVPGWPFAAYAQQAAKVRRIGVLMNGNPNGATYQAFVAIFVQTLQKLGWSEDHNLRLDVRWSVSDPERMRTYAEELVGLSPDLILSSSTANLTALLGATHTTPIVFVQVSDPVAQGFVPNLVHPGGNITGFAAYEFSMGGKWLDLLKQITPNLSQVGVMSNPDTSPQSKLFLHSIEATAPSFGVRVTAMPVHSEDDIARSIEALTREPNGGLLLPTDSFIALHGGSVIDLTARHRLPTVYSELDMVRRGGLVYYGFDAEAQFRQAAIYADRILRGAKPGDLPIELPTKFTLVINLKSARAQGIEVPMSLQLNADEVIE